jgi:Hint domain
MRVAARAFEPGRPHTDLFLSLDHAVYAEDVLIPIRHMVDGRTIAQVPVEQLLVAGFRLCRSGENVNDPLRTLKRLVGVMIC